MTKNFPVGQRERESRRLGERSTGRTDKRTNGWLMAIAILGRYPRRRDDDGSLTVAASSSRRTPRSSPISRASRGEIPHESLARLDPCADLPKATPPLSLSLSHPSQLEHRSTFSRGTQIAIVCLRLSRLSTRRPVTCFPALQETLLYASRIPEILGTRSLAMPCRRGGREIRGASSSASRARRRRATGTVAIDAITPRAYRSNGRTFVLPSPSPPPPPPTPSLPPRF